MKDLLNSKVIKIMGSPPLPKKVTILFQWVARLGRRTRPSRSVKVRLCDVPDGRRNTPHAIYLFKHGKVKQKVVQYSPAPRCLHFILGKGGKQQRMTL